MTVGHMRIDTSFLHAALRGHTWLILVAITWVGSSAKAAELGTGRSCQWGSADCNACVADVARSVKELRNRGDILGFHLGPAPAPQLTKHWQGIQRLMNSADGTFVVSSSNKDEAGLSLVKMRTRAGNGMRVRSNRLKRSRIQSTVPHVSDRIEKYLVDPFSNYKHASGFQSVGHFVAVGLEDSLTNQNGMVKFFDYSIAHSPVELTRSALSPAQYGREDAGTTSLAKLRDQRYLLIVGGSDAENLAFYKSTTSELTNTAWSLVARWNKSNDALSAGSIDSSWGAYQNINLVSQCDGRLFLIATHNDSLVSVGDDWIDAYRLRLDSETQSVKIQKVAKRHVFCSWGTLSRQCNLDAAGGVYIDPKGRLIVYSTEHSHDGPGGTIKMEEFRSALSPTHCSTIRGGWIELYDDKNWRDRGLMIDFIDRTKEDYRNFKNVEGFVDKTSSVRWCLPKNWRFVLHEHANYRGKTRSFTGSGSTDALSQLSGFNDKASSGRYECLRNGVWTEHTSTCLQEQQAALDAAVRLVNF